jgi:NADPH:quinone reductase
VRLPEHIPAAHAAGRMLQGVTAHFLLNDSFPLQEGRRCLIHAGAGGVGRLLIQMARSIGAEVFATAGGEGKCDIARAAGAHHVIDYAAVDFGDAVEEIAGSRPLDVVYDGVGKSTFDRGLRLLKPRGMMVTFGNASGPVDPLPPLRLMQEGSLFLTRPTSKHYVATSEELRDRADAVFEMLRSGNIDLLVGTRLPLAEAAEAHRRLEGRATTGKGSYSTSISSRASSATYLSRATTTATGSPTYRTRSPARSSL